MEQIGVAVYKDEAGYFAILFLDTDPVKMAIRFLDIKNAEQVFIVIESKDTAFETTKRKADELGLKVPQLNYHPAKNK